MIFAKPPSAYTIRDNAFGKYASPDFRMTDKETGDAFTQVLKTEVHTFAGEQWQWDQAAGTVVRPAPTPVTAPAIDATTLAKIADLLSQAQKLLKGQP